MTVDLQVIAADICRNVGREFPASREDMVLRELAHLMEEVVELDEVLEEDHLAGIKDELADTVLTCYVVAHYLPEDVGPHLGVAVLAAAVGYLPEAPYRPAGRAMKAGRRYLGIARRSGPAAAVLLRLAEVVVSCHAVAHRIGIDLNEAILEKTRVVFSRGWRDPAG
jgi:NTP pyrophosphatase (non-canonical NTP hydrolase)